MVHLGVIAIVVVVCLDMARVWIGTSSETPNNFLMVSYVVKWTAANGTFMQIVVGTEMNRARNP